MKNFNNFVPAGYFFLKIYKLVDEVPGHIPAKFYEKIINIAKVMASQRKKFIFSTQPATSHPIFVKKTIKVGSLLNAALAFN